MPIAIRLITGGKEICIKRLMADYEVFSQSGYGFVWSWNGNPKENMPLFYDEVCGLVPDGKACELGTYEKYDFSLFEPDIVIINLGTNDAGAYSVSSHEAARSMGSDNIHYLNEKGEIPSEDVAALKNGAKAFLKKVREKRPGAIIIWAYGMLLQDSDIINTQMTNLLSAAVAEYSKQENDSKVYYHHPNFQERLGINAVLNSGAIKLNGKYYLVARIEGNDRKSFFGVAESDNGIDNFRFWDYPILLDDTCKEETNVYDMRLTQHEDGWIYGVFCSESHDDSTNDLSAAVAAAGIVRTKDLKKWERLPNLVTKRSPRQ